MTGSEKPTDSAPPPRKYPLMVIILSVIAIIAVLAMEG
ncbi:hypothetical protein ABID37_001139 [Aquamicrobium terrae]|uniref:Uncharacterized protein n=1 Tax=Aquamicrobium terrae TaxID=1324945 RepID=A0ABV2MVV8_9HYPH